jgi:periplasmic protein TonB
MSIPSSSQRGGAWSSLKEGSPPPRHAWTRAASVALHALAVVAVVVIPLLRDERLPETATEVRAFFAKPLEMAAPSPPPPPPAAAAHVATRPPIQPDSSRFVAPVEIPTEIVPEAGLDLGVESGAAGGVEGGVPGGVVGGVVGGLPEAAPPPPARPLRAGLDVREPRRVRKVEPVYPQIAIDSHVQGIVILECQIDSRGRVDNVKVLSGNVLLKEAAVEAVKQWVYTPTLLNGVPVPVLMTVTLTFELKAAGPRRVG